MKSAKKTVSKSGPVKKNAKPKNDKGNDSEIIDEVKAIIKCFMADCFYWGDIDTGPLSYNVQYKTIQAKTISVGY